MAAVWEGGRALEVPMCRADRSRKAVLCGAVFVLTCAFMFMGPALAAEPRVTPLDGALLVEGEFSAPRMTPGERGVTPRIEGVPLAIGIPGAPSLPVETWTIVLPPGTRVAKVEALGKPTAWPGTFRLAWQSPPVPLGTPPLEGEPDAAIYGSDALYPAQPVTLTGEGLYRGYRVATLRVSPVQVRAKSGELVVWPQLAARVTLTEEKAESGGLSPRGMLADRLGLARLALNPEGADAYGATKASRDPEEPYLIICPEVFRAEYQRLLDHRIARGMPGRIMTVEEIDAGFSGVDLPEKMRNAIIEAYQQRGTTYVLLGGDDVDDSGTSLVPYRGCLFDAGGHRYTDAPSDWYFGALDGSFNQDGDGIYCEPPEIDYYAEVHVGRATVDTLTEVERFIDKTLAYEAGIAEERRTDLVFIGESLDSSTWGGDSMDVTAGLIDENEYTISRLYQRDGTFSRSAVVDNLNRGPHLTNHLGHANPGFTMGIYRSDVDGLTNTSPFFSYSQGCDAGAFDQGFSGNSEAISEHFLTAEHGGFGVVMNSRYGWYNSGSTNGPSQYFAHEFFDALFTEQLGTTGEANDDSRHDNVGHAQSSEYLRWCFLETNLHGDPAVAVQVGGVLDIAATRVAEESPVHGNCDGETDPGETVRIAVTLENVRSQDATGIEAFLSSATPGVTVRDAWGQWPDLPGGESAENAAPHFAATLDVPCGTFASFTLEIHHSDGEIELEGFSLLVGERTHNVLFADDFEDDLGWEASGNCTTGDWERGEPVGTLETGRQANPEYDASPDPGEQCYVTGNGGGGPLDDEVDNGQAILTSPSLDASGYLDLQLDLARWFFVAPFTMPASAKMTIQASGDDGVSWVDLEEVIVSESAWKTASFSLADKITLGPGLRLRVIADEYEAMMRDTTVEAGLDDVVLEGTWTQCEDYGASCTMPPAPVGNTLRVERQGEHLRLSWQEPAGGAGHDPAAFYTVKRATAAGAAPAPLADTVSCQFVDADACPGESYCEYLVSAWNEAGEEVE